MKSMTVVTIDKCDKNIVSGKIIYFSKCEDCGKMYELVDMELTICPKCDDRKER